MNAEGLFTVSIFLNDLALKNNLPRLFQMEIKTKLVASVINRNVFFPMSAVLFMSATSIRGSAEDVLYCSTHMCVMAPDYIVSPTIIDTDMCSLSISGTCRKGSKDRAPDNYLLC